MTALASLVAQVSGGADHPDPGDSRQLREGGTEAAVGAVHQDRLA
ncbi:MAG TPA: hypothetical protein VF223_13585 [Trebonia sp.]